MNALATRDVSFKKSADANLTDLYLPFVFCHEQFGFSLKNINIRVRSEPQIDIGDFPNNIIDLYWTHKGSPGGSHWYAFGRLNFGAHFFFHASCDISARPFLDGLRAIYIYPAFNYENIIQYAMDGAGYEMFIKESSGQTDATSQMSHPASDASQQSEDDVLQAPS